DASAVSCGATSRPRAKSLKSRSVPKVERAPPVPMRDAFKRCSSGIWLTCFKPPVVPTTPVSADVVWAPPPASAPVASNAPPALPDRVMPPNALAGAAAAAALPPLLAFDPAMAAAAAVRVMVSFHSVDGSLPRPDEEDRPLPVRRRTGGNGGGGLSQRLVAL
ncbi:hypothetical protein Vretifemale_4955, partial [Volvox reticuliferus]